MPWPSFLAKAWFLAQHPELWTPSLLLRALVHPVGFTLFALVFFSIAGRLSGVRPGQHTSRSFLHDLGYWVFYQSGYYDVIFTVAFFSLLDPYLSRVNLLGNWPIVPRFLAYWLVVDFSQYWVHRLRHFCGFAWAFHATHHAEERLTFASQAHVHPIDEFISGFFLYFPIIILGADPITIFPLTLLNKMALAWQHSELPWRVGPLYYIVVTPAFHSFHHSSNPRHYNRNFGSVLSVWDFLFGTAINEEELPAAYGLPDIKMQSLSSQMFTPARLVYEWYFKKGAAPAPNPEPRVAGVP